MAVKRLGSKADVRALEFASPPSVGDVLFGAHPMIITHCFGVRATQSEAAYGAPINTHGGGAIGPFVMAPLAERSYAITPSTIEGMDAFRQGRHVLMEFLRTALHESRISDRQSLVAKKLYAFLTRRSVATSLFVSTIAVDPNNLRLFSWAEHPADIFNSAARREGRLSRLLQAIPSYIPWGHDQDSLLCEVWGEMSQPSFLYSFDIVEGDALLDAYNTGPLSCMKGVLERRLDLYTKNPGTVRLLKIYKMGQYFGRALIWKTDQGDTILDRIYPISGRHVHVANTYAAEQGWVIRASQSAGNYALANSQPYTITLQNGAYSLPYLDTFVFRRTVDQQLILSNDREAVHRRADELGQQVTRSFV